MTLIDYKVALDLIYGFYSIEDEKKMQHLIRTSNNPNLVDYFDMVCTILYTVLIDGKMTELEVETTFDVDVLDIIKRINQYVDETDYNYIDRINREEILSRLRFCILDDQYYIASYNERISVQSGGSIKQAIDYNLYEGYGCHK